MAHAINDIIIKDNNEVANLYPKQKNIVDFILVSAFISKCCLHKTFTLIPTQQFEDYLKEFWFTTKEKKQEFGSLFPLATLKRGFLDSGDKKKKDGGSKGADKKKMDRASSFNDESLILDGIAKHVKNIDGRISSPKSILKKAVCNVRNDKHEAVKTGNDGGSPCKVSLGAVGDPSAILSTTDINCSKTRGSFASLLKPNDATNKVHFRTLINEERVESVDCVLPKAAAAKVKGRYENSIVGFFLGKDLSFLVVQQYVSNTWRKFGFERITRNDDGVYLFKFATKSEDGLSLLGTQIGKPIMLDAFTSSMCEVIMAIPEEEGDGYIKEVIRVEYEWKPPHCVECQSFGHDTSLCPKRAREEVPKNSARETKTTVMEENNVCFTEVKSRRKNKCANFGGIRLNKHKSKVMWQQKKGVDAKSTYTSPGVSFNAVGDDKGMSNPSLNTSNSFDVLNADDDDMGDSGTQQSPPELNKWAIINEDDTTDVKMCLLNMVVPWEVVISLKTRITISMKAKRI
nr:hypothetical protein [Tanacetum cinerariifolium]